MNDLNVEIPDEECVKLFRYEDDDGVAAYLLLFSEHDMQAVKPRIDAQLDHEMAMSVNASGSLRRGVVDHNALDGLMWMVSEPVPLTEPLTVTAVPFLAASIRSSSSLARFCTLARST